MLDTFNVDLITHVSIRDPARCLSEAVKACKTVCPGGVFQFTKDSAQPVRVEYWHCLECGACQLACPDNIVFDYPRGGFGIIHVFG